MGERIGNRMGDGEGMRRFKVTGAGKLFLC